MKKILSFFAAGLLLASCSNDDFAPAAEGQEREVSFSIELPESFLSRAGGSNSAMGGVVNNPDQALEFHAALYYIDAQGNANTEAAWHNSIVAEAGANKVTFKPTLVIGKDYKLVAYASYDQSIDWAANQPAAITTVPAINDETKDAYFFVGTKKAEAYMSATLMRPYGKLRIVTNDWEEALNQFNATDIANVEVTYNAGRETVFGWDLVNDAQDFAAVTETTSTFADAAAASFDYSNETESVKTLMVDYIPAPADGTAKLLNLTVTVTFDNGEVFTREFNMDVPVKRNYLTTLVGDFFTSTAQLDVEVDDAFANNEEIAYNFYKAFQDGGYYEMESDVTITKALTLEAGKTLVLDLNGKTITIATPADGSTNDLKNYGNLTLINGKIVAEEAEASRRCVYNYGEMVIDGTEFVQTYSEKGAAINNEAKMTIKDATVDAVYYSIWNSGSEAELVIDGGKFTTTNDVENRNTWSYCVTNQNGAKLTVNGGEFQGNHGGIYAGSNAEVLLNAGKFHCTAEYTGNSDWTLFAENATILYSSSCEITSDNAAGAIYESTNGVVAPFTGVTTNEAFLAALNQDVEKIFISLNANVSVDVNARETLAVGGASTKSIEIEGNGNTVTFNNVNSDWNNVATKNNAKLTIKNATITNAGKNNGPWNRHDIYFVCPVDLENVVAEKAIALATDATLKNVTIKDANTSDTYAIWIQPKGQSVTLDGCVIDMISCTDGRGIKIDEQYVDAPAKVILNVANTEFKTEEKPAILVKSKAGADINVNNIDIDNVATDNVNAVWCDEASAAYFDLIKVTGATLILEGDFNATYGIISTAAQLQQFADAVNVSKNSFSGKTVKLVNDVDLAGIDWEPIGQTGATTFNGVFDGQNHTIYNLTVNSVDQTGAHYSSGLFGWVESHTTGNGHLKNIKINGANIKGNHCCGALVGYITQGTALVENCHVTGAEIVCTHANDDACGDKAGALIGNATVATPVKDCTAANSTVKAGRDAGQLIGAGNVANVVNCSATNVVVSANGDCTGANVRNEVIGRLLN